MLGASLCKNIKWSYSSPGFLKGFRWTLATFNKAYPGLKFYIYNILQYNNSWEYGRVFTVFTQEV